MSSPQSRAAPVSLDSPAVEEIKTTLYVDSARLKVLSQETKVHATGDQEPAEPPPAD
jgi:hypothetical protein